jgi:hypothetical protein
MRLPFTLRARRLSAELRKQGPLERPDPPRVPCIMRRVGDWSLDPLAFASGAGRDVVVLAGFRAAPGPARASSTGFWEAEPVACATPDVCA